MPEVYERCTDAGNEPGFRYGATHCQSCYDECWKTGLWPTDIDGQQCPGGPQ